MLRAAIVVDLRQLGSTNISQQAVRELGFFASYGRQQLLVYQVAAAHPDLPAVFEQVPLVDGVGERWAALLSAPGSSPAPRQVPDPNITALEQLALADLSRIVFLTGSAAEMIIGQGVLLRKIVSRMRLTTILEIVELQSFTEPQGAPADLRKLQLDYPNVVYRSFAADEPHLLSNWIRMTLLRVLSSPAMLTVDGDCLPFEARLGVLPKCSSNKAMLSCFGAEACWEMTLVGMLEAEALTDSAICSFGVPLTLTPKSSESLGLLTHVRRRGGGLLLSGTRDPLTLQKNTKGVTTFYRAELTLDARLLLLKPVTSFEEFLPLPPRRADAEEAFERDWKITAVEFNPLLLKSGMISIRGRPPTKSRAKPKGNFYRTTTTSTRVVAPQHGGALSGLKAKVEAAQSAAPAFDDLEF